MFFCVVCISLLISILSTYFSKFFVTLQRAPKTTGITLIFLRLQSLRISLLRFLYFSIFFFSLITPLSITLLSQSIVIIVIIVAFLYLVSFEIHINDKTNYRSHSLQLGLSTTKIQAVFKTAYTAWKI